MLWYLLSWITIGFEDDITLLFLIACHTKNRCDRAFGFVERQLKRWNAVSLKDMRSVVAESSDTNYAISSMDFERMQYNFFLEKVYMVLSAYRIIKSHLFKFSSADKLCFKVKRIRTDTNWEVVRSMKRGMSPKVM